MTADKKLKYWSGVRLGVILFFFASIIESVIVIAHIVWIDPAYISIVNQKTIELGQALGFNDTLMDELKRQSTFAPIVFVFRQLMSNVFIGLILSLLITPAASRINLETKNLEK